MGKCTSTMIGYSGDADVDFVRGIIPHHQGAIDMAKVELEYMKAQSCANSRRGSSRPQESEIEMMQTWLKAEANDAGASGS